MGKCECVCVRHTNIEGVCVVMSRGLCSCVSGEGGNVR